MLFYSLTLLYVFVLIIITTIILGLRSATYKAQKKGNKSAFSRKNKQQQSSDITLNLSDDE